MDKPRGRQAVVELQALLGQLRDDVSFRIGTESHGLRFALRRAGFVGGPMLAALLGFVLLVAGGVMLIAVGAAQWLGAPGGALPPGAALFVVGAALILVVAVAAAWVHARVQSHAAAALHRERHVRLEQQRVRAGRDSAQRAATRAATLGHALLDPEHGRGPQDVLQRERALADLALDQTLTELASAAGGAADLRAWVAELPLASSAAAGVVGALLGARLGRTPPRHDRRHGAADADADAAADEPAVNPGIARGEASSRGRRAEPGIAGPLLAAVLPIVERLLIDALQKTERSVSTPRGTSADSDVTA